MKMTDNFMQYSAFEKGKHYYVPRFIAYFEDKIFTHGTSTQYMFEDEESCMQCMLEMQAKFDGNPSVGFHIKENPIEIWFGDIFMVKFADEFSNMEDAIRWHGWVTEWYNDQLKFKAEDDE